MNKSSNVILIGICFVIIIGAIVIIASGSSSNTTKVQNEQIIGFSKKFLDLGFTEEQAKEISKILQDMRIKQVISIQLIENDNNSDISKEEYNELYECYCDDGARRWNNYGSHIYLYFKDKKLVYSCFSNHWGNFYDVNKGVIDYPGNYNN